MKLDAWLVVGYAIFAALYLSLWIISLIRLSFLPKKRQEKIWKEIDDWMFWG